VRPQGRNPKKIAELEGETPLSPKKYFIYYFQRTIIEVRYFSFFDVYIKIISTNLIE